MAASCCCLPLLPFLSAAGTAAGSVFLMKLRPYLLLASVAFIAFGFYQARRARQCKMKPRRLTTALLWFSAAVVVMSVFFPQLFANLLAG